MEGVIYVVIKAARDPGGEIQMATAEKAFKDQVSAEKYIQEKGILWEEAIPVSINGHPVSYQCYCQRAIHPVELT